MNTCHVKGCSELAARYLCKRHLRNAKVGLVRLKPEWGVVLNPPCSVEGCVARSFSRKTLFCHIHQQIAKSGRSFDSVRGKLRNGEVRPDCSSEGCRGGAHVKGMCKEHYSQSRYERVNKNECLSRGCFKRVVSGRCHEHERQFVLHGFTWVGDHPTERINAIRDSKKPVCGVAWCDVKSTSVVSGLCFKHNSDRRVKGCSAEFYINLMAATECAICASTKRLVTDHDHSCHPENVVKMCENCIRGRICSDCNTAIGLLGESPGRAVKLAEFMSNFATHKATLG